MYSIATNPFCLSTSASCSEQVGDWRQKDKDKLYYPEHMFIQQLSITHKQNKFILLLKQNSWTLMVRIKNAILSLLQRYKILRLLKNAYIGEKGDAHKIRLSRIILKTKSRYDTYVHKNGFSFASLEKLVFFRHLSIWIQIQGK